MYNIIIKNCFFNFTDLEASTSTNNIETVPLELVKQNFAEPIFQKLGDLQKNIVVGEKTYHLRGVVVFHGNQRRGLRSATGHYTACTLRGNGHWEVYDDTKSKVSTTPPTKINDVELLFYTQ